MEVSSKRNIAIIATLDSKAAEVFYIKNLFEARDYSTTIIDIGFLENPSISADFSNHEVLKWEGLEIKTLVGTGRRDLMMESMGKGAARLLLDLYGKNKIAGVIALGGNQGTAMAAMAMRGLPFGFPKLIVSTVASGNIRPYVGCKDIGMVFSVGDFLGGPNPVTGPILANAVSAIIGMTEYGVQTIKHQEGFTVAITALGNTELAARRASLALREKGFHVIPFHASGAGGSAMEELMEQGVIQGVLDLTPHELSEEIIGAGAYVPVNPGRLTAAGRKGIPQVVSTGGMEYLCFGPRDSIPSRFRKRKIYMHNPYNANVRVSRNEMGQVGRIMAERLNGARGPAAVMIPLQGWSIYGAPGGPLYDAAGGNIFLKALKRHLRTGIHLETIDAHINDTCFIDRCVDRLTGFMTRQEDSRKT